MDLKIRIPTHLAETLRYKQYANKKIGELLYLANQVASGQREYIQFLGTPLQ